MLTVNQEGSFNNYENKCEDCNAKLSFTNVFTEDGRYVGGVTMVQANVALYAIHIQYTFSFYGPRFSFFRRFRQIWKLANAINGRPLMMNLIV